VFPVWSLSRARTGEAILFLCLHGASGGHDR
jgi:hypothetical protein